MDRSRRARAGSLDRVRLYESVRTAHLERAHELAPATLLYRVKRYDFDESLAVGLDLVMAGRAGAALLLARRGVRELEINEPLMLSSLPATALALVGARIGSLRSGVRPRVVTYAIENDDPFARAAPARLRGRVRRRIERRLAELVWRRVDRVAFGTDAAAGVYRARFGVPRGREARVPSVPSPAVIEPPTPAAGTVLFAGAFVERKGVRVLLDAWPAVAAARQDARLHLVGAGALVEAVRAAAAADPTITVSVDPTRDELLDAYSRAEVAVLPSQPSPRWREQVGLPIVEALSYGCTVVTTDQTGLADWLDAHGHRISADAASADALAAALLSALDEPLDRAAVLASLPERDGRLSADDWLFE